ncbi:unnamed protein product [Durusdinium trenchii]|uniref:Cytochrome P450 n=1 Tax=Durusdinium trenchii TaxID=1381693 RepID=A0ABP0RG67_9DINO
MALAFTLALSPQSPALPSRGPPAARNCEGSTRGGFGYRGAAVGFGLALASRVLRRAKAKAVKELPLPPGKPGNAFLDLIKYIKDPDAYIAEQVKLHGPIFQTNYFGRKTVIVGGPETWRRREELVKEFIDAEKVITKSALPNTFSQLHTEYGTMNQAGRRGAEGSCDEAMQAFLPAIEQRCHEFVEHVAKRKKIALAKELKESPNPVDCISIRTNDIIQNYDLPWRTALIISRGRYYAILVYRLADDGQAPARLPQDGVWRRPVRRMSVESSKSFSRKSRDIGPNRLSDQKFRHLRALKRRHHLNDAALPGARNAGSSCPVYGRLAAEHGEGSDEFLRSMLGEGPFRPQSRTGVCCFSPNSSAVKPLMRKTWICLLPFKLPFTAFGRGFKAKDKLVQLLMEKIEALKASGDMEKPQYAAQQHDVAQEPTAEKTNGGRAVLRRLSNSKDENGQTWSTEHTAHSAVISVWGAYVEVASLLSNAIRLLSLHKAALARAAQEAMESKSQTEYLQAILDESLRLLPPAGGGFRLAEEDLNIGGYRVPKGFVVSADPRISNRDPELHADSDSFKPERFLERPTRQMPQGSWFPGGIGLHGCPGIPLAMLVSKVFLGTWLRRFKEWRAVSSKVRCLVMPLIAQRVSADLGT